MRIYVHIVTYISIYQNKLIYVCVGGGGGVYTEGEAPNDRSTTCFGRKAITKELQVITETDV